jgi:hypothetical protein
VSYQYVKSDSSDFLTRSPSKFVSIGNLSIDSLEECVSLLPSIKDKIERGIINKGFRLC